MESNDYYSQCLQASMATRGGGGVCTLHNLFQSNDHDHLLSTAEFHYGAAFGTPYNTSSVSMGSLWII